MSAQRRWHWPKIRQATLDAVRLSGNGQGRGVFGPVLAFVLTRFIGGLLDG